VFKATIRDVAKQAGVGVGTVSRVINASKSVSPTTRQRVLDAIEALDYRPNPSAQRLSRGRSHTIGVIAPFFIADSYIHRLRGIESILETTDYDLVLFNVENQMQRARIFENLPGSERIDGLILISLMPTEDEAKRLSSIGIPVVLIDALHPRLSYVAIDDIAGAELAVQHLLYLGHRRIGFISDYISDPNAFNSSNRDRLSGYQIALSDAGLSLDAAYLGHGERGAQSAKALTRQLLSLALPPTAIFAANDLKAIAVIAAAKEMGLNVPGDLSVMGYDDVEIAEYVNLTTIRQPLFDSGVRGIELLLHLIGNPGAERQQMLLPIELTIRQTTAQVKTHVPTVDTRSEINLQKTHYS
jgi:DNA-binding LacI/PurR family transcriptional regulator